MATLQYKALGTIVEGVFRSEKNAVPFTAELQNRILDFENRFSRFKTDSELSKINSHAEIPSPVSEEILALLIASENIRQKTDGRITPLIGQAMSTIGYHATFESLGNSTSNTPSTGSSAAINSPVLFNSKKMTVTLQEGLALDFGGIGKGYLLEKLVPKIDAYSKDYWLSLGGDMIVSGTDEKNSPWIVEVQNPFDLEKNIGELCMPKTRLAIATSGITKRHGVHDNTPWHHIIDPSTGKPSETDVLMATVVTPSALEAEAFAKYIIIAGSQKGMLWAEAKHLAALAVTRNKRTSMTSYMRPYAHIYEK